MVYPVNVDLLFHYENEDVVINYTYYVQPNLQDIIEYLFEEEYHMTYFYSSWYLEEGAREFVSNLEELWVKNSIDTYSLYTQDGKFLSWLANKYEEHAKLQFFDEHSMNDYYGIDDTEDGLIQDYLDVE
jgi:hypothetical protein